MRFSWDGIVDAFGRFAPEGSPKRKLLMLIAIVLLFEGVSVLILFSYMGIAIGILSMAVGAFLLMVLFPGRMREEESEETQEPIPEKKDPPGLMMIDYISGRLGFYPMILIGTLIIAADLVFNYAYSPNPNLGDLDTLGMMFGGMMVIFPFVNEKFRIEASFSLLFIGLVVLFLVVPQAISNVNESAGDSVGNWYVTYMLAAPFSGILDLVGIPSTYSGNMVTIQFQDGTVQALGISAYCAGLYSFSIFLAAFFSFVLVFERLRTRLLVLVLALGLAIAFLGNLFRMVIIGVVGYYWGIDALLWAHENVGWVIFLSWSAVFWYVLLGYISRSSSQAPPSPKVN